MITPKKLSITVNMTTLALILTSIVTLSLLLFNYSAQRQLNRFIKLQASIIPELIKAKEGEKDLSTALTQAANLNNELKNSITALSTISSSVPSNTLGASSVSADTAPATTVDPASVGGVQTDTSSSSDPGQILGMVQVNGVPAEIKNIFENPQPSAVVSGSAAGSDFLFYTQKQTGWYQVELNNGNIGWIPEDQVTGLKD